MCSLYDEAAYLIDTQKNDEYGAIGFSFSRIAQIWSGILGVPVSDVEVALCMTGLKLYRESVRHKKDNIVDLYGYTICLHELTKCKD